jgi:hypothetical protein
MMRLLHAKSTHLKIDKRVQPLNPQNYNQKILLTGIKLSAIPKSSFQREAQTFPSAPFGSLNVPSGLGSIAICFRAASSKIFNILNLVLVFCLLIYVKHLIYFQSFYKRSIKILKFLPCNKNNFWGHKIYLSQLTPVL